MKTSLILTLTVLSFHLNVQASEVSLPKHCHVDPSLETTEFIPIPGQPNFFFRSFPQSRLISYASSEGNFILDMDSKKRFSLPGSFDPVPMGEEIITVPDYTGGMSHYSVKEIMSGVSKPQPLFVSKNLKGVYQSIGLIEKNKDYEIYAAIVAGDSGTLYQKIRVSGLDIQDEGPTLKLCPHVDIKLPMISKDGREVSGIDGKSGISKIWKFDLENSDCLEVESLNVSAGKADFSYDGRELIFHMRGDGQSLDSYFSNVHESMNMNIYAYNRDTKSIYPVTRSRPGDNSYFPVYRQDGSIVYAAVDRAGIAQFAKVHPKHVKTKALNFSEISKSEKLDSLLTLGHIWNLSCSATVPSGKISVEAMLGAAFSINKSLCQSMVQTSYDENTKLLMKASNPVTSINQLINYDAQKINLTSEELLQACQDM